MNKPLQTATKDYNLKKALLFAITFSVFSSLMSFFVKTASNYTTDSVIVFFRFLFSLFYISMILSFHRYKNRPVTLRTNCFGMHVLRAFSSYAGQFALFYSLQYIPLADANSLYMTNPLFIPILGMFFLGNKIKFINWTAIIIGFIGVILVLNPGREIFQFASLGALLSGVFVAISLLGIHELGKKDSVTTIMFYYFSLAFIISGIVVLFNWKTPDLHMLSLLLMVGLMSTLCQECLVRALVNAPARIVSPFLYTTIVFSGLLDLIVWNRVPSLVSLVGIIVICTGSILITLFAKE